MDQITKIHKKYQNNEDSFQMSRIYSTTSINDSNNKN
jgi:hypothetical protein